jgi:hypothetical protein
LEREQFISISTGGEIEEKLRAEIDEKNRQLQTLVNNVVAENIELKARVSRNELEVTELRKNVSKELEELKKMLEE